MIDALPWAEDITRTDDLVNYTSNLSGLSETDKERIVREAREIVTGAREGFTPDSGDLSDAENKSQIIGAIATGIFAAFSVPEFFTPRGGMVPPSHTLIAGILGAVVGYYYPLPATALSGALMVNHAYS